MKAARGVSTIAETITRADFRAAFEVTPRRLMLVSPQGAVLAANRAMRGSPAPLPPGCDLSRFFEGARGALAEDLLAAVSVGTLVLRPRPRGGKSATGPPERMEFEVAPVREGRRLKSVLLLEDRSRPVQRSFARLSEQLARADAQAASARRHSRELRNRCESLERFSYSTAHDLTAPLRNIETLMQFLEEDYGDRLPEDGRDLVTTARGAATRLQGVIQSLLDHASSGMEELQRRPVHLGQAVAQVTASLSALISEARARLEVEADLGCASADPALLHQLLENLAGNAIKYRHPDRRPVLQIRREADRLLLADNGRGFDPQLAPRLFQPFQRLHAAPEIEGSGLGLATCAIICERHGWTITAEGRPDRGATFIIGGL